MDHRESRHSRVKIMSRKRKMAGGDSGVSERKHYRKEIADE